jgi:chemotaxis response regulator CheB
VSLRTVLATSDPLFAAMCTQALAASPLELAAAVTPAELLETARQLAPALIVLDADGEEAAALKVLAAKVMLVCDAHVVLASAYLAPGSPGLCALLQSIAATFVHKPEGASSLSLVDEDGAAFVAALLAAFAAHEDGEPVAGGGGPGGAVIPGATVAADFDDGWDIEEGP